MATNSGGWLYEANGTPVDKATADNAQARVLEIKQDATRASADSAKALSTANAYAGQIAQANTTAGSAVAIAQGAEAVVRDELQPQVDALNTAAGYAPGDATDAAMANVGSNPDTQFRAVLNEQTAAYAEPIAGVLEPLDIWSAFRVDGTGGDSWPAGTYAQWIAGIDARLGGVAVKATIGTDAAGNSIHAYTAGPVDAPHALIVGGTHPIEATSQHAAMRFFTEFAAGNAPAMRALRARLRLTWVPTLTPSGYLTSRNSGTGVNINRNFGYNWDFYQVADDPKGSAAFSEKESQAVKNLLDSTQIACVIDCHMLGNTGPYLMWDGPSVWHHGSQQLAHGASARFDQTYNKGATTFAQMGSGEGGAPMLHTWADKYLRYDKGRKNAAGFLIEARIDLAGSQSLISTSREAMRLYCGLIHTYLVEWLEAGQVPVTPQPRTTLFARYMADHATSITAGGSKLDTYTTTPLAGESYTGSTGYADRRTWIDVPLPGPGVFEVEGYAAIDANGTTMPRGFAIAIGYGPTPVGGGDVPEQGQMKAYGQVTNHANSAGLTTATVRGRTSMIPTVGANNLYRFQLRLGQAGSGAETINISRAILTIRYIPASEATTQPLVKLNA